MRKSPDPGRVYAPVPVVAASALLWCQGAIWAALGSLDVAYYPDKTPVNDLLITVFFGFTVLSAVLAVLLPRPGTGRTRAVAAALQWFMTALSLTVLGTLAAFLFLLGLLLVVAEFALAGAVMAACAAGGLQSRSARAFCRSGPAAAGR
jgi:hypothetical protein